MTRKLKVSATTKQKIQQICLKIVQINTFLIDPTDPELNSKFPPGSSPSDLKLERLRLAANLVSTPPTMPTPTPNLPHFDDASQFSPQQISHPDKIRHCLEFLQECRYSSAARALDRVPTLHVAPHSARIQALFPTSPPPVIPPKPQPNPEPITIDDPTFISLLKSQAQRNSAPGASRINAKTLLQICTEFPPIRAALVDLANACLSNSLPNSTDFDSLLISVGKLLLKPNPMDPSRYGARPICINESFTTLVSRAALASISPHLNNILHQHDYGCSKSGAMDAIIHGLRTILSNSNQSNRPLYILKSAFPMRITLSPDSS